MWNTKFKGFLAPLRDHNRNWQESVAVILGNGGASRAVVAGCAQLGFSKVQVVGRNQDKLNQFLDSFTNSPLAVNLSVHQWEELPNLISQANLLVNTTPIGMHPHVNDSPVDAELMAKLPADAIAYDIIYTPKPTQFLKAAQSFGAITIDGLEMLIYQGAAALKIWLNQPIPVDIMRQSLNQHIM